MYIKYEKCLKCREVIKQEINIYNNNEIFYMHNYKSFIRSIDNIFIDINNLYILLDYYIYLYTTEYYRFCNSCGYRLYIDKFVFRLDELKLIDKNELGYKIFIKSNRYYVEYKNKYYYIGVYNNKIKFILLNIYFDNSKCKKYILHDESIIYYLMKKYMI